MLTDVHIEDVIALAEIYAKETTWNEHVDADVIWRNAIICKYDSERLGSNCFIAYHSNVAVGFLIGVTSPCFHRQGIVAEQKLWYVLPSARGSKAAIMLLKAFDKWARLNGATQIFTGAADLACSEKTSHMLTKLGYPKVGSIHMKEIIR